MKKVLWFDSETTGLDPTKATIVQIAGIVEVDGEIKEEFNLKCRPFDTSTIDPAALETQGRTKEEIMKWPDPVEVHKKLLSIFSKYIDKFDRQDKFFPAGHNVKFDIEFLNSFFKSCNDKYFGSWMLWNPIDTMQMAALLNYMEKIDVVNFKLEALCTQFKVKLGGHDALQDIKSTRELGLKMMEMFGK